jgi:hypothetical protein
MLVELQNLQQFRTGLGAPPLVGPFILYKCAIFAWHAGHYQQLLLAICESCKLERFFSYICRNYRQKLFAECLFFPLFMEVNQPGHINQTGTHGADLLITAQHTVTA